MKRVKICKDSVPRGHRVGHVTQAGEGTGNEAFTEEVAPELRTEGRRGVGR